MNKWWIISLFLLSTSSNSASYGPQGVSDEVPVSVDDLKAIVQSGKIKTMEEFLNAIPLGSMKTFTFVTNSLSLQRGSGHGKVSPMWPRVLRASSDGKITISFVCDPRNPSYGKVEVLYFDDQTKRIKSVEWNFGGKNSAVSPAHRINEDPVSCKSCHATNPEGTALKYNWPQYPDWGDCQRDRGITLYGSNDDSLDDGTDAKDFRNREDKIPPGCTQELDVKAHHEEVADYRKFRELQKSNTCFQSLPWPAKGTVENEEIYPYAPKPAYDDYSRRPNLTLTRAFVSLMEKQDIARAKESPNYPILKRLLSNGSSPICNTKEITDEMAAAGIKYLPVEDSEPDYKQSDYLRYLGLSSEDFTLEFRNGYDGKNNYNYQSGNGTLDRFAIYMAAWQDAPQTSCEEIKSSIETGLSQLKASGPCLSDPSGSEADISAQLKAIVTKLDKASIARGRALVQPDSKGMCIQCHSAGSTAGLPPDLLFVPDEKAGRQEFQASVDMLNERFKEGFLKSLDQRLIQNPPTMPPMKNSLTPQDREDIKAYIESLVH